MNDRCSKFPSIDKEHCPHCLGTEVGTDQNPTFTLKEFHDPVIGPTVEIFKNGGPIHRHDEHFRFGPLKAKMLIACIDQIHDFGWGTDEARFLLHNQVIEKLDPRF